MSAMTCHWGLIAACALAFGCGQTAPGDDDASLDAHASDAPTDVVADTSTVDGSPGDASVTDSSADAGGAGSKDGSVKDGSVDAPCEVIDGGATTIVVERVAESAPSGTGDAIAIGTYYAVAIIRYTGDGGATGPDPGFDPLAYTMQIDSASSGATRIESNGVQSATFTYATNGTSIAMNFTDCNSNSQAETFDYSTDDGALAWIPQDGGLGLAYFFQKQ